MKWLFAIGMLLATFSSQDRAYAQKTSSEAAATVVDINTATATELTDLPGIGPSLAERIVAARSKRPFQSPRDLRRVKGIGFRTLSKLMPRISVGNSAKGRHKPRPKRKQNSKAKR